MTPETIATIREVLETEVETSRVAIDVTMRRAMHTSAAATWFGNQERVYVANQTARHYRAKAALDEFNAKYPLVKP